MSATDFRKMLFTNGGNRWIGLECSDGATVTMMIDGMSGYAPKLNADEVNALIDALVEAKQVMHGS
jgi:hypothetical protein